MSFGRINLYFEGGCGDVLLAHRLAAVIKENHPDDQINAFLDTEGNPIQKDILNYLYPGFYDSITTIRSKKYKKCIISSQFGEEEYRGGIHNVPDGVASEILDCDKFYNLHIDSLEFLNHDYDWKKYFYTLKRPTNKPNKIFSGEYIALHLMSGSSDVHRLHGWWVYKLVKDLSIKLPNIGIKIISTKETNLFYKNIVGIPNVELFNGSIQDCCDLVVQSRGIIGVDSFFRLLGHAVDIPTITLSKDCSGRGGVPYSHRLRWLLWPETTFALDHSSSDIINLFEKMLKPIEGRLYQVYPNLALANSEISSIIVKRDYKVDTEKSILTNV